MKQQPGYFRYGAPGSRIPGSRYFRGYCRICGEPIRVTNNNPRKAVLQECENCARGTRNEAGRLRAAVG